MKTGYFAGHLKPCPAALKAGTTANSAKGKLHPSRRRRAVARPNLTKMADELIMKF